MKKYLFVPLGVSETPIGLNRKSIGIALGAIGASILGSALGASSQASANRSNLRATRDTNEMNYQIAKETNQMQQAQFNENMNWLREQYYDKDNYKRAVEAAQRAGLNPALALGQVQPIGSVGQASPSQFHAAHMEAGHVDPISYGDGVSESIGHAVDAYYNNQLRSAQSENLGADTMIKNAQAMTEFASRVADIRSKYADIELKLSQKNVNSATREKLESEKDMLDGQIQQFWTLWDEHLKSAKYGNRLLDMQGRSAEQDVVGKTIENMFKPALLRAGIRLSNAQAQSAIEHLKLIQPQIDSMVSEGKLTDAKSIGQYLMNGSDAIKFLEDNHLYDMYNKNGITKKGRDFFYMFGDLLSHGVKRGLFK